MLLLLVYCCFLRLFGECDDILLGCGIYIYYIIYFYINLIPLQRFANYMGCIF